MDQNGHLQEGNPLPGISVNIVCYEDFDEKKGWILGKFARKLHKHLGEMGVDVWLSRAPHTKFDINHHIIYYDFDGKNYNINTVMVTHIDHPAKLARLQYQEPQTKMFVCMSAETTQMLGRTLPPTKLCYIHAGRNEDMKPRKLRFGIFSKIQESGCKNEKYILALLPHINPDLVHFIIMGDGWNSYLEEFYKRGIEVNWVPGFDYDLYRAWLPSVDYYLYFGFDEGSMSWIDAVACGVKTIATPQGYHLDIPEGIDHVINNADDLVWVVNFIQKGQLWRTQRVQEWTWANYAKSHVEMWEGLL